MSSHTKTNVAFCAIFGRNSQRNLQRNTTTNGDKAKKNELRSPKGAACKRFNPKTIVLDSHDGAEKCWSDTYGSDRSTRTAQQTNQRGTRIRQHHINQINHTKPTIAINLHTVQSATATLRTTHVTTCAEQLFLPRRIPEHPLFRTP